MTKDLFINRTLGRLRVSTALATHMIHLSSSKPVGSGRYEHFGIALSRAQSLVLATEILQKDCRGTIHKCKHDNEVHLAGWSFKNGSLKLYRDGSLGIRREVGPWCEIDISITAKAQKILAGLLLMFAAVGLLDEQVIKRPALKQLYLAERTPR